MDDLTKKEINLVEHLHNIWRTWAKDILKNSVIHQDGSRTIPPDIVQKYISDIILNDWTIMSGKYRNEVALLIKECVREE